MEFEIETLTDRQLQELLVRTCLEMLEVLNGISTSSEGRIQVDVDRW